MTVRPGSPWRYASSWAGTGEQWPGGDDPYVHHSPRLLADLRCRAGGHRGPRNGSCAKPPIRAILGNVPAPLRARLSLLFISLGLGLPACGRDGRADGDDAGGGGIVPDEMVRVISDVDEVIVEEERLRFPLTTHAELAELAAGVVVVGDRQGALSQRRGNPDGFLRRVLAAEVVGEEVVLRTEMEGLPRYVAPALRPRAPSRRSPRVACASSSRPPGAAAPPMRT